MEKLSIHPNGQWKLEKAAEDESPIRFSYSHSAPNKTTEQNVGFTPTKSNKLANPSASFSEDRNHWFDVHHKGEHIGKVKVNTSHNTNYEKEPFIDGIGTGYSAKYSKEDMDNNNFERAESWSPTKDTDMETFNTYKKLHKLSQNDPNISSPFHDSFKFSSDLREAALDEHTSKKGNLHHRE